MIRFPRFGLALLPGRFDSTQRETELQKVLHARECANLALTLPPNLLVRGKCPATSCRGGGRATLGGVDVVGLVGMRLGGACPGFSQGLRRSFAEQTQNLECDDPGCGALRRAPGFLQSPHAACRSRLIHTSWTRFFQFCLNVFFSPTFIPGLKRGRECVST